MTKRERPCWSCGKPTMVKDAAQERTRYPGRREEVLCRACEKEWMAERIRENRERLGLDEEGTDANT